MNRPEKGVSSRTSFEVFAALEQHRVSGLVVETPFGGIDVDSADDYALAIVCTGIGIGFTMEESTERMRARIYEWMRADWQRVLVKQYERRVRDLGRVQLDGGLSS